MAHGIKKFLKQYYDYILIAVVYLALHMFMHTDYWDDISTTTVCEQYN